MAFPVSGNFEARVSDVTVVKKTYADALDAAFNGLYGATRSVLGLALDATGYVVQTVASRTIKAFGASLNLATDTGDVASAAPGSLRHTTGSGGQGSLILNDTTMVYGSTGQQFYPFEADGNGTAMYRSIIGAVQTTDGTTLKTAITLTGIPNPGGVTIVTTVFGIDSGHTQLARQVYCDGWRRAAGNPIESAATTHAMCTVADDIGVTLMGTGAGFVGSWVAGGSNLLFQVKGKAATTINWLVKADILINV